MRDDTVSADGLLIHYEVQGQGLLPALVFIHGWCCDRNYWREQMDYFASQYTVVAIDLGGHGDSGLNRDSWTMDAFGQDVVATVEQLDLHQVVLIGHSMGGTVSVEAARRVPSRVIGLVGVDTFKNLGQTRTKAQIDSVVTQLRTDFVQDTDRTVRTKMFTLASDPMLADTIAKDMAAAPPHVGIGAAEQLFSHDAELRAGLHTMHVPVILINSDFAPTDIEAAKRYGIKVEFMSGVGHFVMREDPDTFNHILSNAIRRILAEAVE